MLRLIIADDEEFERNGFKRNIDWTKLDIEVIGIYEDGASAFDAINAEQPDIVITDIKMPLMDGLTLTKKIKEMNSEIKIILISGYDDFKFAQKAIELKVEKYLLKPYELDELVGAVQEVVQLCENEKRIFFEQEIMKQKLQESFPLLKEKFYLDLLNGIYSSEEKIKKRIEFLEIPVYADGIYVANYLEIDNYDALMTGSDEHSIQLFNIYIIDMIKQVFEEQKGFYISIGETSYAIVLSLEENHGAQEMNYKFIEKIKNMFNSRISASVTIGIGKACRGAANICTAFKHAAEAARYKYVAGADQIIYIEDVMNKENCSLDRIVEDLGKRILSMISVGNVEGTLEPADLLFSSFRENYAGGRYIQTTCIDIINKISKTLLNMSIDINELFGNDKSLIGQLINFDSIGNVHEWMKDILTEIAISVEKRNHSRRQRITGQIKEIIESRYKENLTINEIANEVYFSAGYTSSLFKKETGYSIMDYIIRTRIEASKKMLGNPGAKISEVSIEVGYSNIAYFSSLFKNVTGISPREYRERFCK